MADASLIATRSWLYTPATRPDRFEKGIRSGADVVILDLEDAVASADKETARANALRFLAGPRPGPARALRINRVDSVHGLADLLALMNAPDDADFLVLPKVDAPAHLEIVDRLLREAGKATRLVGMIESVRGLACADAIARATPRLAALMLGAADMAADLGASMSWESMLSVRSRLAASCALGAVLAVDTPFFDVRDVAGVADETRRAMTLGFRGKAAIHPGQVSPINQILTPGDAEIAHARAILRENENGVGIVDGRMIDEAVARQARRVLAAARAGTGYS